MDKHIYIDITPEDIAKNKITFSDSGQVIDELAYSAGEFTSNDVYEHSFEYEPHEPYMFDYEADLLNNTETAEQLNAIGKEIDCTVFIDNTSDLQAGAYMALNHAGAWEELLEAYTEALRENGTDGMSKAYNQALAKEQEEYQDDQYREWLNGDYRDWEGIIDRIAKYYTEREVNSTYDNKKDVYTFGFTRGELHETYCGAYLNDDGTCNDCKDMDFKKELLNTIKRKSEARQAKEKHEREMRKAERERVAAYKKEQREKEEQARKEKLSQLKK